MPRFYVEETFLYLITAESEAEARRIQEDVTISDGTNATQVEFLGSELKEFEDNEAYESWSVDA
jgi:hypothetical protein